MDARTGVVRLARAPLALRPPPLTASQAFRHQVIAAREAHARRSRPAAGRPNSERLWPDQSGVYIPLRQPLPHVGPPSYEEPKLTASTRCKPSINHKLAVRGAGLALAGAMIALAVINNERSGTDAIALASAVNETVVYRQQAVQVSSVEDEEDQTPDAAEGGAASYPRLVQTIKFMNPGGSETAESGPTRVMAKLGAFIAFPGRQSAAPPSSTDWPNVRRGKGEANMVEVDQYLWEVYQRTPIKRDGSGDFTWKDQAAASRMGMSLPEYVIGGMDPEFREQLYHAGQAMDAAGIHWSMLSAFRDDYRQKLAKGFKARVGRSLHGGSQATGGYGHGRAVDLTSADEDADVVWHWIDAHGGKFGLHRPIPGPDPAHVQSRGDWRKLALALREKRLRAAAEASAANQSPMDASRPKAVAKAF
jgi:hypothetical protein